MFFGLLTDVKSHYAFEPNSFLPGHHSPIVSIDELLDFSVSEKSETNDELLPHINTRFETVNKIDFVLQGELADFWRNSIHSLHKGCSAYDLCIQLGLEEKTVRQNLYKLRTTGVIKPVRMFSAVNSLARSRMMKQEVGSFANRISGEQIRQPAVSERVTAAFQNNRQIALQTNSPASQNIQSTKINHSPVNSNAYQTSVSTENIIPPAFLINDLSPLTLPEPDFGTANNNKTQVSTASVNNSINLQNNQSFAETAGSKNPSGYSAQAPVSKFSAAAAHSVNGSVNSRRAVNKKEDQSLLIPRRSNLIKRMLNSLFRG